MVVAMFGDELTMEILLHSSLSSWAESRLYKFLMSIYVENYSYIGIGFEIILFYSEML